MANIVQVGMRFAQVEIVGYVLLEGLLHDLVTGPVRVQLKLLLDYVPQRAVCKCNFNLEFEKNSHILQKFKKHIFNGPTLSSVGLISCLCGRPAKLSSLPSALYASS